VWNSPVLGVRLERDSPSAFLRALVSKVDRVELMTALLVLLGIGLRMRGYVFDTHGLWFDEAAWARNLFYRPLIDSLIRPPGFMLLSLALAKALGPSEAVLRGLSWVAGLGSVVLSVPLSRRLSRQPAARLLFVAIVCLHPAVIDLAKEFKPYSLSLFLHLALLFVVLRYAVSHSRRELVVALALANLSLLFGQDLIFAMPGAFLVLLAAAYRHDRSRVPWICVFAVTAVVVIGLQYWFLWRRIPASETHYWGHKYDVFYTSDSPDGFVGWWFHHYAGVAKMPGMRHELWSIPGLESEVVTLLSRVDGWLWCAIHVAGLARLVFTRRYELVALTMLPIVVHFVFNALGYWPGGSFRTNLFLVAYTAAIAAAAVEWLPAFRWRGAALVPACALVVLPLALFDEKWNARKETFASDNDFPVVMRKLGEFIERDPEAPPAPLHLRHDKCLLYTYYATLHPKLSKRPGRLLAEHFLWSCEHPLPLRRYVADELKEKNYHFWVLGGPEDDKDLRRRFPHLVARSRFAIGTNYLAEYGAPSH